MEIKKITLLTKLNNSHWYKLLIGVTLITNIIHSTPTTSFKEKVCNFLLLPIASSDSSDKTKATAAEIAHKQDPKSKVTIRNLNALGRLLVGYKNTISIPLLNYVLVNEQWLQTLSPKAEEFVLARSMMYLSSYCYEYPLFKYLLPILLCNLCTLTNEYIKDHVTNISPQRKPLISYLSVILSNLLPSRYLRKIEYEIDAKTAVDFNCFDGAIAAITDSTKFSHKGSFLDRLNSKISGIEAADLATDIFSFYAQLNPHAFATAPAFIKKLLTPIETTDLSIPLRFFVSPKFLIPGRFTDRQSTFFNFIKNLPLINLVFDYPKPYKRIRELTELRKRILKDKMREEKNIAK